MDEIATKIKSKNTRSFHIIFQGFKGTSYKHLQHTPTSSFVTLALTSTDIFRSFLELHSTLSEKKIFVSNFPSLTDSVKPSTPFNR